MVESLTTKISEILPDDVSGNGQGETKATIQ